MLATCSQLSTELAAIWVTHCKGQLKTHKGLKRTLLDPMAYLQGHYMLASLLAGHVHIAKLATPQRPANVKVLQVPGLDSSGLYWGGLDTAARL